MRRHWPLVAALLLAEVARITFWAVTGRRYEDALITLTNAENAARGLGFIHHPQEGHVQSFTSALSALIPFAGEVVHRGAGLPTIQTLSLAAAAATMVYTYLIARRIGLAQWPTFFVLAYLALDYPQIIYAMGGMETQIAVAVLLSGAFHVMRRDINRAGLLLGVAVLARPDFVLWVIPALVWLVITERRASGRIDGAKRAALLAVAVIAPWIIFTTIYYGSPVPHTLIAKSVSFAQLPGFGAGPGTWIQYFGDALRQHGQEWTMYSPFFDYAFDQTAPAQWWLGNVAFMVMALGLGGLWLSRRNWELRPLLIYGLAFYAYDFFVKGVHFFQWYFPPFLAIVGLLVAVSLTRLRDYVPRSADVLAGVLALAFALPLPWYISMERTVQHIDNSVRVNVGLYLKAHVKPDESITSESSGYVGYYGRNLKLWDFPGLTSPTAVDAAKTIPPKQRDLLSLINVLQSDWLVLRAPEVQDLQARYPQTLARYAVAAHFTVPEPKTSLKRGQIQWVNIDRDFYVLHRRAGAGLPG
jgi:hypothetical protein